MDLNLEVHCFKATPLEMIEHMTHQGRPNPLSTMAERDGEILDEAARPTVRYPDNFAVAIAREKDERRIKFSILANTGPPFLQAANPASALLIASGEQGVHFHSIPPGLESVDIYPLGKGNRGQTFSELLSKMNEWRAGQ
nr:hypothetical protein [Sphingobium nicotianae]